MSDVDLFRTFGKEPIETFERGEQKNNTTSEVDEPSVCHV